MAGTQVHNITITDISILADVGKSGCLDCDIACKSSNGKYYFGSGYYQATHNSDDVECIYLFNENEMIYRKKFEDTCIDRAVLADDGTVFFYTEDYDLISLHPDGKQSFKKNLGVSPDYIKFSPEAIHLFGCDDDGDTFLVFFDCANKKLTKIQIPDIDFIDDEGEEDALLADATTLYKLDRGYIIIYENHQTCLMYDFDGNKLEPSDDEQQQAITLISEKAKAEKLERERKQAEREIYMKKTGQEQVSQYRKRGLLSRLLSR